MQVSIANFLPSPVSGLVLATFISEGSEDIAAKLRTYGIEAGDMSEIARERGKKSLVQLPGALLWTMGMGPKPSRERIRQAASQLVSFANEYGHEEIWLICPTRLAEDCAAIAESLLLTSYQFLTYKSRKKPNRLKAVHLLTDAPEAAAAVQRSRAFQPGCACTAALTGSNQRCMPPCKAL